jgi:hypothetical protein
MSTPIHDERDDIDSDETTDEYSEVDEFSTEDDDIQTED